jgi:hypothetical protein
MCFIKTPSARNEPDEFIWISLNELPNDELSFSWSVVPSSHFVI